MEGIDEPAGPTDRLEFLSSLFLRFGGLVLGDGEWASIHDRSYYISRTSVMGYGQFRFRIA